MIHERKKEADAHETITIAVAAVVLFLIIVSVFNWMSSEHRKAMDTCKLKHSFDTCFQILNR